MSENINQDILEELRKLRSVVRRSCYLLVILVVLAVLFFPVARRSQPSSHATSWETVRTAMAQEDFPKALADAQALVSIQPGYYYGHAYLGAVYVAMGDFTNAEVEYQRAYELFPSEQCEKDLAAVRKRLAARPAMDLLSK